MREIDESSDSVSFGIALIGLQAIVGILMMLGFAYRPLMALVRILSKKHVHDGTIRGITGEHDTSEAFMDYFVRLALSDEMEGGWEEVESKQFAKPSKKKQKHFKYGTSDNHTIAEDKVTAHVRCSTGDGPIDQIRLKCTVSVPIDVLTKRITNVKCETRHGVKGLKLLQSTTKGNLLENYIYVGKPMPFPLYTRDFVIHEVCESYVLGGNHVVLGRSVEVESGVPPSVADVDEVEGVTRGTVHLRGYLLQPDENTPGDTKVTYIESVDLHGILPMDLAARALAPRRFKEILQDLEWMKFVYEDRKDKPPLPSDYKDTREPEPVFQIANPMHRAMDSFGSEVDTKVKAIKARIPNLLTGRKSGDARSGGENRSASDAHRGTETSESGATGIELRERGKGAA